MPPPPPPPPRPGQSKPVSGAAKTATNSLVANFHSTAPLSGNYRVKWRGKISEETPFSSIMKQVEAGEIGMISQILVNDQWLTIRDFLARHKQAEAIRIAEEIRRAEEEKARQLAEERAAEQARLAQEQAAEQARLGREKALEDARQHELAIARARAPIAVQQGTASGVNQFIGVVMMIAIGGVLLYFVIANYGKIEQAVSTSISGKKVKTVQLKVGEATITDDTSGGVSNVRIKCNNGLVIKADWQRNSSNEFGYDIYEPSVNMDYNRYAVMMTARSVIAAYLRGEYD